MDRQDYDIGDKIILHSSILQEITQLNLQFPLIFFLQKKKPKVNNNLTDEEKLEQQEIYRKRLTKIYTKYNTKNLKKIDKLMKTHEDDLKYLYKRVVEKYGVEDIEPPWPATEEEMKQYEEYMKNKFRRNVTYHYCGVKDFTSPEANCIYMEKWMMDNLGIESGTPVMLTSKAGVQSGTFCEFIAMQSGFCAIINAIGPKFLLEYAMKRYSVLFPGERILIPYEGETYELYVNKVKPENENVVSLLGTVDLEVAVLPLDPDADVSAYVGSSVNADEDKELWAMTMQQQIQMAAALEKEMQEEQEKYEKRLDMQADSSVTYKLDDEDWNEDTDGGWGAMEDTDAWDASAQLSAGIEHSTPQEDGKMEVEEAEEVRPNEKKCPHCQKWISSGAFFMHEMRCARLITKCKECGETVSKPLMEEHMKKKHIVVECACGETVRGTDELSMHQKTDCIYKMMTCEYCNQQFKQIEFSDHVERCANEPFTCLECGDTYKRKFASSHVCSRKCHCGERIPLKMYIFHKITNCPQRRALCTYCKLPRLTRTFNEHLEYCGSRTQECLTCGQLVILKNMEDHIQSNCTKFSAKQTSKNMNDLPAEYLRNIDFFNDDANYGSWNSSQIQTAEDVICPPAVKKTNTMEDDDLEDKTDANKPDAVQNADSDKIDFAPFIPSDPIDPQNPSNNNDSSSTCPFCGQECGDPGTLEVHKQFECIVATNQLSGFGHQNHFQAAPTIVPQRSAPQVIGTWTCQVCTLENQMSRNSCEACNIPRSAGF